MMWIMMMKWEQGDFMFKCNLCKYQFTKELTLNKHVKHKYLQNAKASNNNINHQTKRRRKLKGDRYCDGENILEDHAILKPQNEIRDLIPFSKNCCKEEPYIVNDLDASSS